MKNWIFIVAGLALALACNKPSSSATTLPPSFKLENTHWKLVSLAAISGALPAVPKEVFLVLKESKINGYAGCNNYFGGYTLELNSIHFTPVGSTKMFCSQGMDLENKFLDVFRNADQYRISGTRMELLKAGEVLAAFEGSASN